MFFTVENASFGYFQNNLLFRDINFTLNKGEILAIMGPNGVGKTTLIKCIMGILDWNSGVSYIENKEHADIILDVAYVPQGTKTSFSYTVMEMVLFGRAKYMSAFSLPQKSDYDIAINALKDMGIYHLKDRTCNSLSGGQLQMVMVARALAAEPKLLILDEPESHLDFYNQVIILDTIKRLAKEKNIACILNTHYPNHAIKLADKVLLLGKKEYISAMKKNQLTRALRVDKMTLVALEGTLRMYLDEKYKSIPTFEMLTRSYSEIKDMADEFMKGFTLDNLNISLEDDYSEVGGGAMPTERLSTRVMTLESQDLSADYIIKALRDYNIPIIARINDDKVIFDFRTIKKEEFKFIKKCLIDIDGRCR